MTQRWRIVLGIGAVLCVGPPGHADRIHLRNGNTLRGVIVKQDDTHVVIRVGPKMKLELGVAEIVQLDRDSPEVNQQLRANWGMSPDREAVPAAGPQEPQPATSAEVSAAKSEESIVTPEQVEREAVLDGIDIIEGSVSPEEVRAQVGAPQSEKRGKNERGQPYIDWTYDIGADEVMTIRFLKTAGGYYAMGRRVEQNPSGASRKGAGTEPDSAGRPGSTTAE